jgi:phytoene synthase
MSRWSSDGTVRPGVVAPEPRRRGAGPGEPSARSAVGPGPGDSIRLHSRSFSFASRLLPASKRVAVEQLYAWCRWCDDGVDTASAPEQAAVFLDRAAADLRLIAAGGMPTATESRWLASLVRHYRLPVAAAEALLAGMRSDLAPVAGLGEKELLRYCFRVAGAVGVLMCPILGLEDRRFLPHAAALGMGMQLTNIARDVAEDWRRSRCYLPVDWTGGLRPGGTPLEEGGVRRGVDAILRLADGYYAAGDTGIAALDRGSRVAVLTASRVYHAIGTEIRKRRFRVLEERARVSAGTKLRLFVLTLLTSAAGSRPSMVPAGAEQALATAAHLLREHGVA